MKFSWQMSRRFKLFVLWATIVLVVMALSTNTRYSIWHGLHNVAYLVTHPSQVKEGAARIEAMKRLVMDERFDIQALDQLMDVMLWYQSNSRHLWQDRRDWMLVFAMKGWRGDCDDYAAFAAWVARKRRWRYEYHTIFYEDLSSAHAVVVIYQNGKRFLVDEGGVRPFVSWKKSFPKMLTHMKRWF